MAFHVSTPVRKDDECKADMEEEDDPVKKQEGHIVLDLDLGKH